MMPWEKCKKEFIRKVEIDKERVMSIVEMAERRLRVVDKIEVSEKNVSFIIEGYYETIKELLVAYLLKNGLRAKNHQCLISYFYKENPAYEFEANLLSQMSYYRNRLDYYGESIPLEFYEKNKKEIVKLIELLKGLLR